MMQVAAFADSELGALILAGNSSLNTGMPLTDNQKARQVQIKDTDKKRAAAAKVQSPVTQEPDKAAAGFTATKKNPAILPPHLYGQIPVPT